MCKICTGLYDAATITTLDCSNCNTVTHIKNMPMLHTLLCSYCPQLLSIAATHNVVELECVGSVLLQHICNMPLLQTLNCQYCVSLVALPVAPNCSAAYVAGCALITHIGYTQLRVLECSNCNNLLSIAFYSRASFITTSPTHIVYFYCKNSPLLYMQQGFMKCNTALFNRYGPRTKASPRTAVRLLLCMRARAARATIKLNIILF